MPIVGVPTTVAAIYTTTAGQSIAHATTTIVDCEIKVYDTHGAVTTGAGWIFTTPVAGFYQVSAQIMFEGTTGWIDTEWGRLSVYVNAVHVIDIDYKDSYGSALSVFMKLGGSSLVYLNAGDNLNVRVYQYIGAALALYSATGRNHISIVKV